MRFEIGQYYKYSYNTRSWLSNEEYEVVFFFRVTNIVSIADEDTISYVGFGKNGEFEESNKAFKGGEKVIEISPMDFYKAYKEYYVTETNKDIKRSRLQIEEAKKELQDDIDGAEEKEKKLLAGLGGIQTFFQKSSIKEVEVKDNNETKE